MKLIIIHNPASGRRRGRRKFMRALEALRGAGVSPQVLESRNAQHLTELARQAVSEKPDLVVSAGGDGTHHYVMNGIFGSGIPLGILSVGSGNDFAKGLGIPLDPGEAARTLLGGRAWQIDVARVRRAVETKGGQALTSTHTGSSAEPDRGGSAAGNPDCSRVYGCIAGTGFDSIVTRFTNDQVRHVHGSMAYAWALLRCLKYYRPFTVEVKSDRQNFSGRMIFATIGNNTAYGGGIRMAPHAQLDDGLLDVCIVPEMSKLELLRWVPNAYRGTHLKHPRMIYFQARTITLRSESRLELFGDGEFMRELPATIEVVPRSLDVIVPAGK